MLHLVQTRNGLDKCRAVVQPGDAVVFISDGVTCIESFPDCDVHIQVEDAERCGISNSEVGSELNMNELLDLVVKHDQSVSWR